MTEPTNKDLVERVLGLLPANNYAAAKALQVAEGTIRRWRRESVSTLRAETRNAILHYLRTAEGDGQGAPRPSSPIANDRAAEELRRRLDDIEAQDIDEAAKIWKIGAVGAAYRAKALADVAAALRHDAHAAELRNEAALARARAGEDARLRSLITEAVETHHVPPDLIPGIALPIGTEAGSGKAAGGG